MSYEIFTFETRGKRRYVLQGKGEHDGTNVTLSDRDLFPYASKSELASYLDRRLLLAHADRKAYEAACMSVAEFARAFFEPLAEAETDA